MQTNRSISTRSVLLPLQFLITGILALLVGTVLVVAYPDVLATYHYNQRVIALTHLFNLGWITSVIMGAAYQLAPVALETKLFSERLARWHYWFHLAGFVGMVWMFWIWNMAMVGAFGSVLSLGVALFVYNIARTLAKAPRRSVTWSGIVFSLSWLSLTVLAGLYQAATKFWGFGSFDPIARMHAHAHLGVIGFFLTMMIGVSFKLIPMFSLGEVQSEARARWSLWLLNTGLTGVVIAILYHSATKPIFAGVVASGVVLYGVELRAIVSARKRRALDWGVRYFLTAVGLLVPVAALGLLLSWPMLKAAKVTGQLENVYGFLAIIGVVTLALMGMLYKIIPFLVWYARYSPEVGHKKTPALNDLYSARLQCWGYWIFISGLGTSLLATGLGNPHWVQAGSSVLVVSFLVFAVNVGSILSHLFRRSPTSGFTTAAIPLNKAYANSPN